MNAQPLVNEASDDRDVVADVLAAAAGIIGGPALSAQRLTRGGNNVTLCMEAERGSFVVKHYPQTTGDTRDRFASETRALGFMNTHGFEDVPQLIGSDDTARVAVMTESGTPADTTATTADIDACIGFVSNLFAARTNDDADDLPEAAEACAAPIQITAQIRARRARLNSVADNHTQLRRFLDAYFDPTLESCEVHAWSALSEAGINPAATLAASMLTLSPSDFGLHNAVRGPDGTLIFVDFEYFGWDDPVRLACDFLLHPGHNLSDDMKTRFAAACVPLFGAGDIHFQTRIKALYPLVGLRWCMILLNEFLPERMARRRAAGNTADLEDVLRGQLDKAHNMLSALEDNKRLLTE